MSRSFLKFTLSVFVVAAIATVSYAQDETNMARPLTKSGSAAFVFNLGGIGAFGLASQPISQTQNNLFTNAPIAGAGMKYFIADDLALKVLLAFGTTSNGDTSSVTHLTTTTFGIGAGVEYHMRPLYSTSPYIGAGIKFATSSQTTGTNSSTQIKTSGSEFNIGVFAGFDWFFTKGLALGAEYGLGFTSNSSSSSTGGKDDGTKPSPSAIVLGLVGSGSLHLIVYF